MYLFSKLSNLWYFIIAAWDDYYSQSLRLVQTDLNIPEDIAPTHFCSREWPRTMYYLHLDERNRKFLCPNIG